jgi:CRISPR/Cas system-associated protein endoribonuclease Cas2
MMTVIAIASFLVITGFILLRIDVYRNVAKQRAAEKEAEEKAKVLDNSPVAENDTSPTHSNEKNT